MLVGKADELSRAKRHGLLGAEVQYAASDSFRLALVVQADPIPYYPAHALPTEYWTRPIDAQLREWYPIAGSWLETPTNMVALGNDDAPETPRCTKEIST
jgi:hypothetical protein